MALKLIYHPGQTPIDPDEAAGLIPTHLSMQGHLNEWEAENIFEAVEWLASARIPEVLTEKFCRQLHSRMFGSTWRWAGTFRTSDKSIGCDWRQVPARLQQLLQNVQYWLDHATMPLEEAAVRFHHQLVLVHPFPKGNGRHARLMTDHLLRQVGAGRFNWGAGHDLVSSSDTRSRYIDALRAADRGDIHPLLKFCSS